MSNFKIIKGDLIALAKEGKFDVIVHGCNCHSVMGAGLAPQMAKAFGCDTFEMELWGSDINKLGNIDYQTLVLGKNSIWNLEDGDNKNDEHELTVINAYTQFNFGKNHIDGISKPIDYQALELCMKKINRIFNGNHIGLPMIGAGLAGGDWNVIEEIIKRVLSDCEVTIVVYDK